MKTTTTFTAALCVLAHQVIAQDYSIGGGAGPGPENQLSVFEAANQNPNATGSIPLDAIDTSENDATLRPVTWTASINVTDVPINDQVVTNSVLSFSSSPDVFTNNSSWQTCMVILRSVALNATVDGQDDTGDCKATFGDDCVGNFTSALSLAAITAVSRKESSSSSSDPCSGFAVPPVPKQCQGMFTANSLLTSITTNQTNGSPWVYSASESHSASNTTYYQSAATRIWPLMIVQTYNGTKGASVSRANMGCLRAKNATAGSDAIKGVPGSGMSLDISVWGFLAIAGVIGWLV